MQLFSIKIVDYLVPILSDRREMMRYSFARQIKDR